VSFDSDKRAFHPAARKASFGGNMGIQCISVDRKGWQ